MDGKKRLKKWMVTVGHAFRNLLGPDHPEYFVPTLPDIPEAPPAGSRTTAVSPGFTRHRSQRRAVTPYKGDYYEERHENLIQELGDTDGYFDDFGD